MTTWARSVLILLICVAATWSVPHAAASNFTDDAVSGSFFISPLPVNLWDIQEILASPDDNLAFLQTILSLDSTWQNVRFNSTTVPVSEANIEFGLGVSQQDVFGEQQGVITQTFTFDIFQDGRAIFEIACESDFSVCEGFRSSIGSGISATVIIESLVGGTVEFVGGNINSTFLFDATTGNLTFAIIGAEGEGNNNGEPVPTPSEERITLEFKLSKATHNPEPEAPVPPPELEAPQPPPEAPEEPEEPGCTSGGCCDKETGKALAKDTVCRVSTNPCEVKEAKCDGVTFECPDNEPVEDGTTCKWVSPKDELYGKYMTAKCEESAGLAASSASSAMLGRKGPKGDWGMCEGMCMEGMCVLDCEGPTCCYTGKKLQEEEPKMPQIFKMGSRMEPIEAFEQGPKRPEGPKGEDNGELMCWE